jgi:plastocyanin
LGKKEKLARQRHLDHQQGLVEEGGKPLLKYLQISYLLILLIFWGFMGSASAGDIEGTVKVKGLRSPADILVYLTNAPAGSADLSGAKVVMDQRNLTFFPHVLPILVGTTVHFPNNDKVDHNVFSLSRTKQFSLGSYKPGEIKTVLFDKPGIVELRCDVHAEMAAFILVMKNPYWAMTDYEGHFEIPDSDALEQSGIPEIKDLPPGKYFLKTWHEKLKSIRIPVTVEKDGEISVQLDLTRGTPGVLYK